MKKSSCLLFLIFAAFATTAQISPLSSGIQGHWLDAYPAPSSPDEWQAQWIWMDAESHTMLARRSFELETVPSSARLRITASSQYQLYINERYIARGPARSAPHHQYFDDFEVSAALQKGKNTLAVRVHHQQGKHSYHHLGRGGLLVQLEANVGGEPLMIISDDQWKVSPDPSWDNGAPKINRFQVVVADKVDLRKQLIDWEKPHFDDDNWANALPLMRNVGWPNPPANAKPQAFTPPWTALVPRDLPYLKEGNKEAKSLISSNELSLDKDGLDAWLTKAISLEAPQLDQRMPLTISASQSPKGHFFLFDLEKVYMGMPQLDIEGIEGAKVHVLCAPFIVNGQFSQRVVDSDFRDEIILSGKRDQWEATYFKPVRYLGILLESGEKPIKIHRVGVHHIAYPFEQKGHIKSADAAWVEDYMEATAKTIKVCTTDGYTDNYRERRQYAQTGYYGALGNYWIFRDHALQRRYLAQVAQEQIANGIMPAYAPLAADDYMIIMDSNCLWIRSLRTYFLWSGDSTTVKKLLSPARKLMALLHSYTNEYGMIYNPPYPYWLDHAQIDRRGANLNLNGHYLGALEDFAEVLDWLGESDREIFQDRAKELRASIGKYFWNPERQLFVDAWIDGEQSEACGEHANAMALAMGIATEKQAQAVAKQLLIQDSLDYINRSNGMTMVTPAMSHFLHKGLAEYGFVDESFELFRRRFDKMLDPTTNGTLWEEWWLDHTGRSGRKRPKSRSDGQTESCFPPDLFGQYLLGIEPVEPGLGKVVLSRPNTDLQKIEGSVPGPKGNLDVKWTFEGDGARLRLDIPKGMAVSLNLKQWNLEPDQVLKINGGSVNLKKEMVLTAGKVEVVF